MKNLLTRCALLVVSTLVFTSCLTVTENYTFNKNGSGSMEYILDMSELSGLLAMAANTEEGGESMSNISMAEIGAKLRGVSGISQISFKDDKAKYIYSLSFKFANITALNNALQYVLNNNDEGGGQGQLAYFSMEGNTLSYFRSSTNAPLGGDLSDEEDPASMYEILEAMKYKLNFKLPKTAAMVYTVGTASSGGKKGRTVNVEANFREVAENDEALSTTIVMK